MMLGRRIQRTRLHCDRQIFFSLLASFSAPQELMHGYDQVPEQYFLHACRRYSAALRDMALSSAETRSLRRKL
jgi:hypothetical protein